MKNWQNKKTRTLFRAIVSLKTGREASRFFRDLCTLEEIEEMANRWEAARLLNKGVAYRDIAKKLGMSTTTVSRIANWLNNGMGGYKLVLKRHHASFSRRKE